MKFKGKIIQIEKGKSLQNLMISPIIKETAKNKNLDLVVLLNSLYPKGWKGYFLSFKKDKPMDVFPILMDSTGLEKGKEIEVECDEILEPTGFFIK